MAKENNGPKGQGLSAAEKPETFVARAVREIKHLKLISKRNKGLAVAVVLVLSGVAAVLAPAEWWSYISNRLLRHRAQRSDSAPQGATDRKTAFRVAVFYPSPTGGRAANKDGAVQHAGFNEAFEKFDGGLKSSERHAFGYEFYVQSKEQFAAPIFSKMKEMYVTNDVRVFILTMSGACLRLRTEFANWRNAISDVNEKPLLICTVASAPGIADIRNGILRFYVRSEDESTQLARYGFWRKGLTNAAILFITRDLQKRNDPYGDKSRDLFASELRALGGNIIGEYEVDPDGTIAKDQVTAITITSNNKGTGVFVVGYGTMFQATLKALVDSRFAGGVLCASTVTEEEWHPKGLANLALCTVEPLRKSSHGRPPAFEQNIVRFFSYYTLLKALECAKDARSTPEFIKYWQKDSEGGVADSLDVEYLANGDTIVKLRPVDFSP